MGSGSSHAGSCSAASGRGAPPWSANELAHWLEGLREGMPHLPPLLLALAGRGPHMSRLQRIIYNEWPNHWIERFDNPAFRSADPILTGPVRNPVIWSHEIAKIRPPINGGMAPEDHDPFNGFRIKNNQRSINRRAFASVHRCRRQGMRNPWTAPRRALRPHPRQRGDHGRLSPGMRESGAALQPLLISPLRSACGCPSAAQSANSKISIKT